VITGEPRCPESGHVRFGGRLRGKGPVLQAPRRAADPSQFTKNETGLDHYQIRRYDAWYRHITLSMLAAAFLAVTAHTERTDDQKGAPTRATTPTTGPPGDGSTRHERNKATTSDNASNITRCGCRTRPVDR
jgi:hypothetical protein